jgi:DNA-directed RNA polymerase subunit beta'
MLVAVGLSFNSKGEINDIILNEHASGLEQTEFFNYSSGAIMALYAKSAETAVPGYLARKISTITEQVRLSSVTDCKSTKYLEIFVEDERVLESLDGRILADSKKSISKDDKHLINTKVKIRSPLFCKAQDGICSTCYNPKFIERMKFQPGEMLGLIASTHLSADVFVNLALKKSHTGFNLDLAKVDLEKDALLYSE